MKPERFSLSDRPAPESAAVVSFRLPADLRASLERVAAAVCPSKGRRPGGLAEVIRRAVDFYLSLPADRRHAEDADAAGKVVPVRLFAGQVEALDRAKEEAGLKGRGELVRRAVAAYLATAPEAAAVSSSESPRPRRRRGR